VGNCQEGGNEGLSSVVVAVTGGTGFIGTHLVRRLVADGLRVRALSRRAAGELAAPLREPAVQVVRGDLGDAGALTRLVAGAGTVYHLAGCATPWERNPAVYDEVNVAGTARVCDAALAAGVSRLVHVSTNLVEAREGGSEPPLLTRYQRTKADGERVVHERVARGLHAVIVRPGRVFGPGPLNPANSVTVLIDQYRRGLFRTRLADGGARGNWVYVGDLVDGMVRAAQAGHAGVAYMLGGANCSVAQFLDLVAEVTGRRRAVVPLPVPVALTVAAAAEFAARFGATPFITRDWVRLFAHDWPSSAALAERDLGYAPHPLREGIATTVEWLASGRDPW